MDMPDIRTLVPHAGPMVLLDRVISADEESLCAEVRIRHDSLFCRAGAVGAWVGLEYMAQAIGAYAGFTACLRGEPIKLGYLLGTRCYECTRRSSLSARCCGFTSNVFCRAKMAWVRSNVALTMSTDKWQAQAWRYFSRPEKLNYQIKAHHE